MCHRRNSRLELIAMTVPTPEYQLGERSQGILRMLVEQYIRDGQPVGSRTLSRLPGVGLSAATVRNVMGDLEEMGLLVSPHTSAGRIPSSLGYRIFVDTLLEVQPLATTQLEPLREGLEAEGNPDMMIKTAVSHLSNLTQMASVVIVPRRAATTFRQIEFLHLSSQRVLAILVINEKEVQNKIIPVQREYTQDELVEAANFLNQHYTGRPLEEIRQTIRQELEASRNDMNQRMQAMTEAVGTAVADVDEREHDETLVVDGQTNLMNFSELSDVEKLKNLFDAFNQKRDMYHLLERSINAEGIQIFIGRESGFGVFDDCSVITAPYAVDDNAVGVLGVVGPTRMAYERVIPIVDVTSKLLSAALNSPE